MSRILIAFASHYGQTRKIASRLADHLRAMGHEIDLAELASDLRGAPPPEDYDVVVLGSRVEVGKHAPSVRSYARVNHASLRDMPIAVFSVSLAATRPGLDPNGYLEALCKHAVLEPARRAAFAGALRYRSYHTIMRFVMKLFSRRAGLPTDTSRDHELTDWRAVRAFASEISALCPRPELELVHA